MDNPKFQKGMKAKITGKNAPPDRFGAVGTVETVFVNGVILKLDEKRFTTVRNENLEIVPCILCAKPAINDRIFPMDEDCKAESHPVCEQHMVEFDDRVGIFEN